MDQRLKVNALLFQKGLPQKTSFSTLPPRGMLETVVMRCS